MTDSARTISMVPSPRSEISIPINDLLAIPEIVNRLPAWIQEPFRRFVRLRQRNWPARSINDYLKNMPGKPQQADEEGKLEADGSRPNQSCNKLGIGTYQKSSPAHFLKR